MRLLHVADLHLDRSFEGISEFPSWVQEKTTLANEQVWQNILQLAITKQVDVVVLAGDTFHQSCASLRMQRVFFDGLQLLAEKNIAVVLTFGNHDYYRENQFWFSFPENVTVFTSEAVETKELKLASGETAAFSAFSYRSAWMNDSRDKEFPSRGSANYHIGIYHGESGSESRYAPFSISELTSKGYDYWALGHIHKGGEIFDRGYYAGTPQGHSQKETDGTGVLLVDFSYDGTEVQRFPVEVIRWKNQVISLKDVNHLQEIEPFLLSQIAEIDDRVQFLQLRFTDYQQLGDDFFRKLENGELLHALQQEIARTSHETVFLWQLDTLAEVEQKKTWIPNALIQQVLTTYQNEEIFKLSLQDLLDQPELLEILDVGAYQKQVLTETEKMIQLPVRLD